MSQEIMLENNQPIYGNVKSSGLVYEYFIFGEVGDPQNYIPMIETLDSCEENDVVNIRINTVGGNLDTAISIIHAIRRSKAKVIGHADGYVYSAGSAILFSCPNLVINEYSSFMFHDANHGIFGKLNETYVSVGAVKDILSRIYHDVYSSVFTKEEIESILEGKDVYLNADQVLERINQRSDEINVDLVESSSVLVPDGWYDAYEDGDYEFEVGDSVIVSDPELYPQHDNAIFVIGKINRRKKIHVAECIKITPEEDETDFELPLDDLLKILPIDFEQDE